MHRHIARTLALLSFALVTGCGTEDRPPDPSAMDGGTTMDASDPPPPEEDPDSGSESASPDGGGDGGVADSPTPEGIGSFATTLADASRDRAVGVRVHYPRGSGGQHQLVLVSHGGLGGAGLEDRLGHIGASLAEGGFVAVHVGHRRSPSLEAHRRDRPLDVSFVVDRIADGSLSLPADFDGTVRVDRYGHTGHSAGAYTSLAVGGAAYDHDTVGYRDPRVAAIAPISPQGTGDFFEAYDRGADDNTWAPIDIPVFILLGGDELDTNGPGEFQSEGWRLAPWMHLTDAADRIQVVVADQGHLEMGQRGSMALKRFIGTNLLAFFDAYLRDGDDACDVGALDPPGPALDLERRPTSGGRLEGCE